MGVELRPNVHYTAEMGERIGIIIAVRTDEKDKTAYVIEEANGRNSVLPVGKDTSLSAYGSLEEAQEAAGFEIEFEDDGPSNGAIYQR